MIALPVAARTYEDKVAFCYRSKQALIDWHNKVGAEVDQKDAKALILFREWVRTEWEPRFKAAMLTLHSLSGFSQLCPPEFMVAQTKQAAINAAKPADKSKLPQLTTAEVAAVALVQVRTDLKVAGTADKTWDAWIDPEKFPRLGVMGEPPDPTLDLTTFTSVDAAPAKFTITSSRVTASGLANNDNRYLYSDRGAGHFAANFTHLFTINTTSVTGQGDPVPWMVSNEVYTPRNITNGLYAEIYYGTTLYLSEKPSGSYDGSVALSLNTPYYCKAVRDEDVGTYGTLYVYIYSDSGRTTLVDTVVVTLAVKADFRYYFAMSALGSTNPAVADAYSENHDLGEAAPWSPACILGALQQSRIIGGGLR
jgi:hypothetical protein